ncbi:DUF938 domain-containing protein [Candidatus Woesearchaeota archaeon]|nr:DUF938 domain-containing protein [Candidatus Woesearchaeota archaeon]
MKELTNIMRTANKITQTNLPEESFTATESIDRQKYGGEYKMEPTQIGEGQTCSAPYIHTIYAAIIHERLKHKKAKILEIGTGTGTQAAIIARLLPNAVIITTDIYKKLTDTAVKNFKDTRIQNVTAITTSIRDKELHALKQFWAFDCIFFSCQTSIQAVQHFTKLIKPNSFFLIPIETDITDSELRIYDAKLEKHTAIASVRFVPYQN